MQACGGKAPMLILGLGNGEVGVWELDEAQYGAGSGRLGLGLG